MDLEPIDNVNVTAQDILMTPAEIKRRLPITPKAEAFVRQSRHTLQRIIDREDPRLFVVVGPCSIHDLKAARDYAQRLKRLAEQVEETLFIIMRVYFEKPRTSIGWKGFVNDPYMNDSFQIEEGLQLARGLLLELAEMGIPAGTEALDPISPQYLSDLITWYAIGARTTESQTHREMASGLSAPVGFKNNTDGSLDVAINAMLAACRPHNFLGINTEGQCAIIRTKGNRYGHVVLRGGGGKPNYDSVTVALCEQALASKKLSTNLVIDCSHANSHKDPALQPLVLHDCVNQIREGNQSIIGVMLESNINFGNQSIPKDLTQLQYGVSVTDGCIDWVTTEKIFVEANEKLREVLPTRLP